MYGLAAIALLVVAATSEHDPATCDCGSAYAHWHVTNARLTEKLNLAPVLYGANYLTPQRPGRPTVHYK